MTHQSGVYVPLTALFSSYKRSRRIIGELIVYPVVHPKCLNIFSENTRPIKAKFHVEPH